MSTEEVQELKTLLEVVKKSPTDKIDEAFYDFMIKVKDKLGEEHYDMAYFCYEYANFLIKKMEANIDIFNPNAMPQEEQKEISQNFVNDNYQNGSSELQQPQIEQAKQNQQEEKEEGDVPPSENEANNQPEIVEGEEVPKQSNNEEEQADQGDICFCNLALAQKIYEKELQKIKNGESQKDINQVLDWLKRVYTRTGDLFLLHEHFEKSIELFQKVIDQESQRQGHESDSFISGLHLLIGANYLNSTCSDCEVKAIKEFIKGVNILVNHLNVELKYDTSEFELPTEEKCTVSRLHYSVHPGDSPAVIQDKEIISQLLDRIEDTKDQIADKKPFQAAKQEIIAEKNKNQFKPVQEGTKVVNLGVFGNKKKKTIDAETQLVPSSTALQEKTEITNSNSTSLQSNTVPKSQEKA